MYARVSQEYQWIKGIVCNGNAVGPICDNVGDTSQPNTPPSNSPTVTFVPTGEFVKIVKISAFQPKIKKLSNQKWRVVLRFKLKNSTNNPVGKTVLTMGYDDKQETCKSLNNGKCTIKLTFGKSISSVTLTVKSISAPGGEVYTPERNNEKDGCPVFSSDCPTYTLSKNG